MRRRAAPRPGTAPAAAGRAVTTLLVTAALLTAIPGAALLAAPAAGPADVADSIGFEPALGETIPQDVALTFGGARAAAEDGRPSTVGGALGGFRHTVLVPVWFGCRKLCDITLASLARAVLAQTPPAGTQVLVVSINPEETPADSRRARNELARNFPGSGAAATWRFATLDEAGIGRLSRAIGFRFDFDAGHAQFRHAAGAVVLDGDGVQRAFLPGPQIRAGELHRALASDRPPVVARIASYCFAYDPETGRYSFSILRALRLLAFVTIAAVALPCWRSIRREGRQ